MVQVGFKAELLEMIDWTSFITACEEVGGTEWFSVEQEDYPDGLTPMQYVERSLKEMGKE